MKARNRNEEEVDVLEIGISQKDEYLDLRHKHEDGRREYSCENS
jgi:hypothetical protein